MALSADGHQGTWTTWDGAHEESFSVTWDNEAWTATGIVGREAVQYVLRVAPTWEVRQFLLFRDVDTPDLWLATDAERRWGEMNGVYRPELDGSVDIELACSPLPLIVPIRRLGLGVGESAEVDVITVDHETLGVVRTPARYDRTAGRTWRRTSLVDGSTREVTVDDHGLVIDEAEQFRRRR